MCAEEVRKTASFNCKKQAGKEKFYYFCVKDFNSRQLKQVEQEFEDKCMSFLEETEKYEQCMKGLEENDFFVCKQFLKSNAKFQICMNERREQRMIRKRRKLKQLSAASRHSYATTR